MLTNNNISFESLKFKNINNMKIPENFSAKLDTKSADCFVKINAGTKHYYFNIEDKHNLKLGESISNTMKEKVLFNSIISRISNNCAIYPNLKGIGSILHLTQVVTMLENDINKIELYSMSNSIYFHSKFKFKPAIKSLGKMKNYLLDEIINKRSNDKRFEKQVADTIKWLNDNNLSNNNKMESGNEILYDYIQTVLKYKLDKDKNFRLSPGIEMELTKDNVLKEKKYFNKLFNKFNIDYQIND